MEIICSGSKLFSFRVSPKFEVIQLALSTIKLKNKKYFFICQRVWETAKSQGKIREKSGNFEVDDKWQPYIKRV